jgi:phosphohistidine phosphatase
MVRREPKGGPVKQLILVRHAKSSWKDPGLADADRPLNERGKRDAPDMGKRLARRGVRPDLIVSSPARRAVATAKLLAAELAYPPADIEIVKTLYEASEGVWLAIVRGLPAYVRSAMIVGHNPEITAFVNCLCPAGIDNVPTCGMLILGYETDSWGDVGRCEALEWDFDYPRREQR